MRQDARRVPDGTEEDEHRADGRAGTPARGGMYAAWTIEKSDGRL